MQLRGAHFLLAAPIVLLAGCELITSLDPSLIQDGGGGHGGGVPCVDASECPPAETECGTPTCVEGACGVDLKAAGTPATAIAGNCSAEQCDGKGGVQLVTDDADLPNDASDCTEDLCTAGVASNPPLPANTACGAMGTLVCDGMGVCVGCDDAAQCGSDTDCVTFSCSQGECGSTNAPAGTPTSTQVAGDCQTSQCDGSGGVLTVDDNSDLPVDNQECTQDLCSAGTPSNPPEPVGTACGVSPEQCDGTGSCVECLGPADCPGVDTECQQRACTLGVCGFTFTAANTPLGSQTPFDCQEEVCDGAGGETTIDDDTDLPDDGNDCTMDVCTGGVPSNPDEPQGTACGMNLTCDGSGNCVGCLQPSDCGQDTECVTFTCSVAGTCGTSFTAAGTVTTNQAANDCQQNECDGSGNEVSVAFDSDLPLDDGNECTDDICSGGVEQHPAVPTGDPCTIGGTVCSASGVCVDCNVAADCPGTDTDCSTRTCLGNTCGNNFTASGTPTSAQTAGDCQQVQCNGSGGTMSVAFNTDLPPDEPNACTSEVCNAGVPEHPPVMNGTSCNDGNSCTQTDTCQTGVCTGSNPIVCTPLDQCHVAGTCNPGTGVCSNPNAPDGTGCSDGDGCTQTDTCQGGTCSGANPVVCTPQDQCHVAGTCDSGTGLCSNPNAMDGTACDDGTACTQLDACSAGVCTGSNPVVCTPLDQCHVAGTCDAGTGVCTDPNAPDGTLCTFGVDPGACVVGTCQADTLFFNEYVEGTSNNKALEIANPLTSAQNLGTLGCQVLIYSNGSATVTTTINLTGSVAAGDVYTLCNSSATFAVTPGLCDQSTTNVNFNGDDAVELRCGLTTLDVIGQIGFDPGTEWGTGNDSTADNTLRRSCGITNGDPNGLDAFDPSIEYAGFATDDFTGLGSAACAP